MLQFEFATATRILFGAGKVKQLGALALEMGQNALLVVGRDLSRADRLIPILKDINLEIFQVAKEPTVELVQQGVELARLKQVELVIGFGGGSVLDAGKAIAGLATNPGDIYEYLEVIGSGKTLTCPSLAFIAVPTTAGTGSEVTRNAVLGAPLDGVKVSLRSSFMLPRLALVDPELTYSLPPALTASTGLDALTQLIEPWVSNQANPITDAICQYGIPLASRSLRNVYQNGLDANARQDMSLASMFGGLALANAKLGAVHGFAGVLGGVYSAPHGSICARLLPEVMLRNILALTEREPEHIALHKYRLLASQLTGDPGASEMDGIVWVKELCTNLEIQGLSVYGLVESNIPDIVVKAQKASSMKGNPITLTSFELSEILHQALN